MTPHRSWWRRLFGLCLPGRSHDWDSWESVVLPIRISRCRECGREREDGSIL